MKPMSANEADYEEFEILGREALFTNMRIDRNTLPDGLYAYDLRDECNGEPCELKSFVLVNHWGTVIFEIKNKRYTVNNVVYPDGDSQLVWCKWHTPQTEQQVEIKVTVYGGAEASETDITANIVDLDKNPPPNPTAYDRNNGFTKAMTRKKKIFIPIRPCRTYASVCTPYARARRANFSTVTPILPTAILLPSA